MTVQQERPTAASATSLPVQRSGVDEAAGAPPVEPAARPAARPGAWVTREDRLICHGILAGMLLLSLYASLLIWLGTSVWG